MTPALPAQFPQISARFIKGTLCFLKEIVCFLKEMIFSQFLSRLCTAGRYVAFWLGVCMAPSPFANAVAARPPRLGRFRVATCDRWGDVAVLRRTVRAEAPRWYCARARRRALRERCPPLPLLVSTATRAPPSTAAPILAAPSPRQGPTRSATTPADSGSPSRGSASVPVVRDVSVPRIRRGLGAYLSMCPAVIAQAELREAPVLFNDICDGGAISAAQAISRYTWAADSRECQAAVLARALDLLPRAKCPPAWAVLVCNLSAMFLEDICPAFYRVRMRAADRDTPFSLVPLRGRFGWRKRARWAGLDDAAGGLVDVSV